MRNLRSAGPALLATGAMAVCVLFCWLSAAVVTTSSAVHDLAVEQTADRAQAREVQQRITELPEDGQAYHVSICLHDDWQRRPNERALKAWWSVDPRLVTLAAQTHFHVYVESDPVFRTNIAGAVGQLPAVLIQNEHGEVKFKASGANLPESAPDLGDAVVSAFGRPYLLPYRNRHNRPCPCPPNVTPAPKPNVDVNVNVPPRPIPDTPIHTPASFPWLVMLAVSGLAGAAVLAVNFFKPGGIR